jgi:hypothetical protein
LWTILPGVMRDHLWTLLGLGSGSISAVRVWIALGRRRTAPKAAAGTADPITAGEDQRLDHLAPTVETAELQLAMLFRRLRAYLRDPYDFAASRIADEAQFEDCLDLAADLSIRAGNLCGAATTGPAERERARGQILQGLMLGNGALSGRGTRSPAPPSSGMRPDPMRASPRAAP